MHLLLAAAPDAGFSTLPENPYLAGGVLVASVLCAFAPYLVGRLKDRDKPAPQPAGAEPAPASVEGKASPALPASAMEAIDAQGRLLSSLVADVQRRLSEAEYRLEQAHRRLEVAHDENTKLREQVATLTAEVAYLRNKLIDRGRPL